MLPEKKPKVISVELVYPTGARRDVLLADVPRVGESIRPRDANANTPSFVVDHVLWLEGGVDAPEPSVVVVVRNHVTDPAV